MKEKIQDTIVAPATAIGYGSVGILRISGSLTSYIAHKLLKKVPKARYAEYLSFYDNDGNVLDKGIALFFPHPYSFTGEDTLELQGHGSPIVLDLLIKNIISFSGVRIANPGEFSERAFLNKKLDLTQAEAISDLIYAKSSQAAKSAINSLQGEFSNGIYKLVEKLIEIRSYIEATIEFPDEEINYIDNKKLKLNINDLVTDINNIYNKAFKGKLLREGIKVVITGEPNVGKSSLLNILVQQEVAIVTPIEGTTRDIICEYIDINGMPIKIIDTAGLRCSSNDEVEKIGINRAWDQIKQANHILLVIDSSIINKKNNKITMWPEFFTKLPKNIPLTIIHNKIDLIGENARLNEVNGYPLINMSTKYSLGLDILLTHLKNSIGMNVENTEGIFLARQRHLDALKTASQHIIKGQKNFLNLCYLELLAEEFRLAQEALNTITGTFSSNDLLKKIFSTFCIGK